ncbi:MAG: hypothetical protein H0U36_13010 [Nocardioidaceae bacterium]|nr:hypothetical protein [Nocardioidaceae bacterium]
MSSEHVGTLPEEAAKLIAVLQGWATDHSPPQPEAGSATSGTRSSHPPVQPECRYCAWCRLLRAAKATSPEVREHLTSAATSFALALQGLLETPAERHEDAERDSPLENIDPSED